ncbi:FtsX-like permease family protein [Streptomyces sp. BE147]|uniref:FtsX-like permease family protein n=1 Tax=unclassified Streptomyces TaxID=2593676 RepID=UPI002E775EDC|nr:FtsX-like permease family protein [Streptomyces sp. BE147]MEE1738082.1 FtsX-like permease family protein [Streptomyces sp. BE147]
MLSLALQGMKTRWVTFVGSFIALALGVGLIATTGLALAATFSAPDRGPERFAKAPVVVQASDRLRVDTPIGVRTQPLDNPRPVPEELAARLAGLGRTVEDRTFPVTVRDADLDGDGEGTVGHPWSVAGSTPYRISGGRAPSAPGEVVVTAGPGAGVRTGDRIEVATSAGTRTRTVVGTVATAGFETAVFFTDAEAARISPAIDAVVVHADAERVRALAGEGTGMVVLTGDDRRRADPDPDRDDEAMVSVNALLGTAAAITGFVSVFVVASTFSFAVAQRRREFGLLRTAGATPNQVRRMVYAEAVVIGILASAAGCWLGAAGAPRLAAWMVDVEIAPHWFAIGDQTWPLHTAFWTGLFVAMAGVLVSSYRAGKVGPTEALRESAVDSRAMPLSRWLMAVLVLLTGLGLLGMALVSDPGDVLKRKTYITQPMLLIVGFALFAPVLVRPLTRLLTWLPAQLPGATGVLARENAAAGVRRTAAVAAPVIITVALAASLMGTTATINEAKATEARNHTVADFVIASGDEGRALSARFVERARAIDGATVSASRSTGVTVLEEGTALVRSEAKAVTPAELAAVSDLPVVAGRLTDLDDGSIVVNEEWLTTTVGRTVSVWLGDGRKVSLKVAAVLGTGTGSNGVYLTPRNAAGAGIDRIDVKVKDGADRAAVAAALREAGAATGTEVLTRGEWVEKHYPRSSENTRLGLLMILGIALVYTGIALANTLVMATSDRVRDLAVLRLSGATKAQVLRLVAVEALVVVAVGAVIGGAVAALNLLGVWGALGLLDVWSAVVVPWGTVGAVVAASAVLATVSAVLPASFALRTRPVELAGMRE